MIVVLKSFSVVVFLTVILYGRSIFAFQVPDLRGHYIIVDARFEDSFPCIVLFSTDGHCIGLLTVDPSRKTNISYKPGSLVDDSQIANVNMGLVSIEKNSILRQSIDYDEWKTDRNWKKALREFGVVPTATIGKPIITGMVMGLSLDEHRFYLTLSSEFEASKLEVDCFVVECRDGGLFVKTELNGNLVEAKLNFVSRHGLRMSKKYADILFGDNLVSMSESRGYIGSCSILGKTVHGTTLEIQESLSDDIEIGFELMKRLKSEFVPWFTGYKWNIVKDLPPVELKSLYRFDFDSTMDEFSMRIVRVYPWGLVRELLRDGDTVLSVNGALVRRIPKYMVEEMITNTAVSGGVVRVIRDGRERDVEFPSTNTWLQTRDAFLEAKGMGNAR
jgi:hypothetical protein